jgi:acyl dehydratase
MSNQSQSAKKYAFEDMTPGTSFELGPYPVTAEEIIAFASEFDPQPMHLDEEAGKASLLGGLAASGWHTSAIMMRMFCDAYVLESTSQGAPGVDFSEWKKPVLAGDVLRGISKVVSARPMASQPGLGIVQLRHEIFNQRDELVVACENPSFMTMRNGKATS